MNQIHPKTHSRTRNTHSFHQYHSLLNCAFHESAENHAAAAVVSALPVAPHKGPKNEEKIKIVGGHVNVQTFAFSDPTGKMGKYDVDKNGCRDDSQ